MLLSLSIKNIALIDDLHIDLQPGLNILTGETGAGKSILIHAIKAVIGDRVYRELIRTGCDQAHVKAVFSPNETTVHHLAELGYQASCGQPFVLSRTMYLTGKNLCKIEDQTVTVSELAAVGALLVDIHGQFDASGLMQPENHIHLLDRFGDERLAEAIKEYNDERSILRQTIAKRNRYATDKSELERKMDMLSYQIREIEAADLMVGEEQKLNEKKDAVENAEKIRTALESANVALNEGDMNAVYFLNEALHRIGSISNFSSDYAKMENALQEMVYTLEDVNYTLKDALQDADNDPNMLDQIIERLNTIDKLKKKYGKDEQTVLSYLQEAKKELDTLQNSESILAKLHEKIEQTIRSGYQRAKRIHTLRCEVAKMLEQKMSKELDDMEMKKVTFNVSIQLPEQTQIQENDFGEMGLDNVEFLISPNTGESEKPLAKIASGGELSRIMLAIKTLISDRNHVPVMIFDEIDAGISGEAALMTGRKIHALSSRCQVLCVTHLPQIASMADHHYVITKKTIGQRTHTVISKLSGEQRAGEIASLLDGHTVTQSGKTHAVQMLDQARAYKQKTRSI